MTTTPESARARRYLLGEANEDECSVIEQEYLAHEEAVDRIAAAEDELIEDYINDDLSPADRDRFERAYLSVPHRRVRVETIRRLMAEGSRSAMPASVVTREQAVSAAPGRRWLALAASLLLVGAATLWFLTPFGGRGADTAATGSASAAPPAGSGTPGQTGAPPGQPGILALTLSPAAVRGASDDASAVISPQTTTVALRLEGDADGRTLTARRAEIRTPGGNEVWEGPVATGREPSPGTVARIDVPAEKLPPDDYVITLYGTDQAGVEQEWTQYFLRVRAG